MKRDVIETDDYLIYVWKRNENALYVSKKKDKNPLFMISLYSPVEKKEEQWTIKVEVALIEVDSLSLSEFGRIFENFTPTSLSNFEEILSQINDELEEWSKEIVGVTKP